MAAWNGRPVLALTSLAQVPLVPPSPGKAGARAGFLAAFDNSGHTPADEINFAYAKHAASQHDDYEFSRQWLVGLAAGKALLAKLAGVPADMARARAEEDRIVAELAADRAAGITGDASVEFEFYDTPAEALAAGYDRRGGFVEPGQERQR